MARLRRNVQSGAGGLRAAAVGRLDLAEYSRLDRRNHRGKHRDSLALGEVGRSANRSPRDSMTASRAAVALAISGGAALSSLETTVLLTVEDTLEALRRAKKVQYRPPGA